MADEDVFRNGKIELDHEIIHVYGSQPHMLALADAIGSSMRLINYFDSLKEARDHARDAAGHDIRNEWLVAKNRRKAVTVQRGKKLLDRERGIRNAKLRDEPVGCYTPTPAFLNKDYTDEEREICRQVYKEFPHCTGQALNEIGNLRVELHRIKNSSGYGRLRVQDSPRTDLAY